MNALVALVVYLLMGGVVIFLVYWIVGMTTLPPNLKNAILVVVSVLVIIWLLSTFWPPLQPLFP